MDAVLEFARILALLYLECLITYPFQTLFWTVLLPVGEVYLHRHPEVVVYPFMALTLWWADTTDHEEV